MTEKVRSQEADMADRDTPTSTSKLQFPDWQQEFEAALLEGDPQELPLRVKAAEAAIVLRQQELIHSSNGDVERQAIFDAMRTLRAIQTEKMHNPARVKK